MTPSQQAKSVGLKSLTRASTNRDKKMHIKDYIEKHHGGKPEHFRLNNKFDLPVSYQNVIDWQKFNYSVIKIDGDLTIFPKPKRKFKKL